MTQSVTKAVTLSPLGRSALFMAAGRAIESAKSPLERMFYDPYAHLFANSVGRKYLKKMSKYAVDYIKHRTLYIDNHINNIINKFNNCNIQIIILGVGCDTRSYRMNSIKQSPNITVYELDLDDVIKYRYNVLIQQNQANLQTKANVIPISVDFRNKNDEWINTLIVNGYNNNNCNIWIAEGLFPYLTKNEINLLFDDIQKHCYNSNLINNNDLKHWFIGNCLNENTMLQSRLNKLNKDNGNITVKTGYSKPHLLLKQFGYNYYEIKPIGSLNKNIKTYEQYLKSLEQNETSQHKLKIDHFAKSFMFCCAK